MINHRPPRNILRMYELDLIIFIKCSGDNARPDNIRDTIVSFMQKNVGVNYGFYIVTDPHIAPHVTQTFRQYPDAAGHLVELKTSLNSWATDFNEFYIQYKDLAEWLLICHDDVVFKTEDYFNKLIRATEHKKENIGWITSGSDSYYTQLGIVVTDTFRPGFHKDNSNWGAMFQLHKLNHCKGNPSRLKKNLHLVDYPPHPVKIHGPMSAIMMTTMSSMEKIGICEDWTRYTMLIDEDWSLSALKNNLWNVWVPDVFHSHPNRRHLRISNNKWEAEAHAGLLKKWGFDTDGAYTQGVSIPISELREQYAGTNVPWSSYRNSYEWEYLDD
jgi:hypothetical protein